MLSEGCFSNRCDIAHLYFIIFLQYIKTINIVSVEKYDVTYEGFISRQATIKHKINWRVCSLVCVLQLL